MNIEDAKEWLETIKEAFQYKDIESAITYNGYKDAEKAIEVVLTELDKYEKQLDLDYVENNYVRKEIIQHELDKKDRIINEMADMLVKDHEWFYSEFDNYTKQDFIDYFTKKVEGE